MINQFTASEVRRAIGALEARDMEYEAGMLRAYADMLEAQEGAVPVVTRESAINAIEHIGRYNGPGRETEARQMLIEVFPSIAHHAQAQPPAASVTDAMVNAAMRADFCGHNVADALMCGTDWNTEVMRTALEAALAAQENPNG